MGKSSKLPAIVVASYVCEVGTLFLRHDEQDGREECMGWRGFWIGPRSRRLRGARPYWFQTLSWERHGVMIYFCSGKMGPVGADKQHAKPHIAQKRSLYPDLAIDATH